MTLFQYPDIYAEFPNEIHSINLEPLFNSTDPLDYFRKLYTENIEMFYIVRNELMLRGINLSLNYQNNYFPDVNLNNKSVLIVDTNKELYKNVNFTLLDLPNFPEKYNVNSDLFFHRIPLEGFTFLAKNCSMKYVEDIFTLAGFKVLKDSSQINNENEVELTKIEEIFSKKEVSSFLIFCRRSNISYMEELTPSKIEEYKNMKGVGIKSYNKVKSNYETYLNGNAAACTTSSVDQKPNLSENYEDQQKIHQFIKPYLKNGYAFTNDIYLDMQFDEILLDILHKYEIDSTSALSRILINLVEELNDTSNFLYLRNSPVKSIEILMSIEFPQKTSRKNITSFLEEKGYSNAKIQSIIRNLLSNKIFWEYDSEILLNREYLKINEKIFYDLNEYLKKEFDNKEFLSVSSLVGFRLYLPSINVGSWTTHLIFYAAQEIGYKPISGYSNYKNEKLILVLPNSSIKNFHELIYYILKKQYTGPMHVENLKHFLVDQSLCNTGLDLSKTLLYSSLFQVDNLQWITLKK